MELGMLGFSYTGNIRKRNEAFFTLQTKQPDVKRAREKIVNRLLANSQEIAPSVEQEKCTEDLGTYPLKGWLNHSSDKDQKVRRHFWKLQGDSITLFLSERESLFYKQFPLSKINRLKALKKGQQLVIMLNDDRLTVSTGLKDLACRIKVIKRWKDLIKKGIEEAKATASTSFSREAEWENKGIFGGLQFALDLTGYSFKKKKELRELISKNGGQISYIITRNTKYLLSCEESTVGQPSSFKSRKAAKLQIPVVDEKFVRDCVDQGLLIEIDFLGQKAKDNFTKGKISLPDLEPPPEKEEFDITSVKKYKIDDEECPDFPEEFFVPKYSLLEQDSGEGTKMVVVEAQIAVLSENNGVRRVFRVTVCSKSDSDKILCSVFPVTTVTDLTGCYEKLVRKYICDGFVRLTGLPAAKFLGIVSEPLGLILSEMKCSSGVIHPEVVRLVQTTWTDSTGELKSHLRDDPEKVTLDQVRNAMIALLKIEEALKNKTYNTEMSHEFYKNIIPKNTNGKTPIDTVQKVAKKRELCQVLKDVLVANEVSLIASTSSSLRYQYTSLKCSIAWLSPEGMEFKGVRDLLPDSSERFKYKIENIFKVNRSVENIEICRDLNNKKLLFHASAAPNFVGILSRGLLMPSTAISELGIPRHDEGKLGCGIYFSDSFELSSAFTTMSQSRGTRLLLVNEVMLGEIFETEDPNSDLLSPPQGFHSVKGIGLTRKGANEYAIYNSNQQRMKYIIEFTLNHEAVIPHSIEPYFLSVAVEKIDKRKFALQSPQENMEPKLKEMQYGLILEGEETSAKMEEFHIRAKIIDLVSEITVFQAYKSFSRTNVEAKYVFPLSDSAAVCGFEAFINEKHVVGVVKEKEEAHREYKKAVAEGHGAYLMDEEKPNIFSVSLGNIPPSARVVIKITYVSELETVNDPESCVLFSLPGKITQWQKDEVLLSSSVTQSTTESTSILGSRKSSFVASIDMPFDILDVICSTHKIVTKKTATKACVKLQKKEMVGDKELRLLIKVAEIHVPRIWIETNEEDSGDQVAMVTFFPEFDFDAGDNFNCTVVLDLSNSMSGSEASYLKYVSSLLFDYLPDKSRFNVIAFGLGISESFVGFENSSSSARIKAKKFVEVHIPGGGSDVLHVFSSINLLLEENKVQALHNIFLLSDGHLSDEDGVLRLASVMSKKSHSQTRIFSFGIGSSINAHLLKSLSVVTGGNFEHFSPSTKNTWKAQLRRQIDFASQPALTNVNIDWCNYESKELINDAITSVPEKVKCVFAGSRLTAYSFLPGCTKATLSAEVNGREFSTTIMAHSLSYVEGKTLHRLAAKAIFKEYESGRLANDGYVDQMIRDQRKSSITKLSIKHSVISKFTSFVAIEKRERNEDMSISSGPLVSDLVGSAFSDIIPEVGWELEEMTVEENIDQLLKRSAQLHMSSILQARELAIEAKRLCDGLSEPDNMRLIRVHAALCRVNATPEGFDPFRKLIDIFWSPESAGLDYDVVNSILKLKEPFVADAIDELATSSWPDFCSVQLASLPKNLHPVAVGLFVSCQLRCLFFDEEFVGDEETMIYFWRRICCIDVDHNNTADVLRQAKDVEDDMCQKQESEVTSLFSFKEYGDDDVVPPMMTEMLFDKASSDSCMDGRDETDFSFADECYECYDDIGELSPHLHQAPRWLLPSCTSGSSVQFLAPSSKSFSVSSAVSPSSQASAHLPFSAQVRLPARHLIENYIQTSLGNSDLSASTASSERSGPFPLQGISSDRDPLLSTESVLRTATVDSLSRNCKRFASISHTALSGKDSEWPPPPPPISHQTIPAYSLSKPALPDAVARKTGEEFSSNLDLPRAQNICFPGSVARRAPSESFPILGNCPPSFTRCAKFESSHTHGNVETAPTPALKVSNRSSSLQAAKPYNYGWTTIMNSLGSGSSRSTADHVHPASLNHPLSSSSSQHSLEESNLEDQEYESQSNDSGDSETSINSSYDSVKDESLYHQHSLQPTLRCVNVEYSLANAVIYSRSGGQASKSDNSAKTPHRSPPNLNIQTLFELIENDVDHHIFCEMFPDLMPDEGLCRFPLDKEIARERTRGCVFTKVLKICKTIVISAGGRSLGPDCLAMALDMLLTALMIEMMKLDDADSAVSLQNSLKKADAKQPSLYQRLELGYSWESAAHNVAKKIVEQLEKKSESSISNDEILFCD